MTAKPAPGEHGWSNGLRSVDATHTQLARSKEVFGEHQGAIRAALTFVERVGIVQPGAASRFSRTTATLSMAPAGPGARTGEALISWGIEDVEALIDRGVEVEG